MPLCPPHTPCDTSHGRNTFPTMNFLNSSLYVYFSKVKWYLSLNSLQAHPDGSTEQPLDAKPLDQKQEVIIASPDDPRMLETMKEAPILVRLHLGHYEPQHTVVIASVGRLNPALGGAAQLSVWQHAKILHQEKTNILCGVITQQHVWANNCFYGLTWWFCWG